MAMRSTCRECGNVFEYTARKPARCELCAAERIKEQGRTWQAKKLAEDPDYYRRQFRTRFEKNPEAYREYKRRYNARKRAEKRAAKAAEAVIAAASVTLAPIYRKDSNGHISRVADGSHQGFQSQGAGIDTQANAPKILPPTSIRELNALAKVLDYQRDVVSVATTKEKEEEAKAMRATFQPYQIGRR